MIPKRHILSPVQALFLTKALNENYCQIISGLPLKALLQNKTLSSMKIFFTSNSHLVSNKKTKSVGMFEIKQYRKIKILLGYQTQKSLPKNTPRVFQVETMQKRPWCVFCVVCA